MMLAKKQKESRAKGCLMPIVALLGFILVCFVFCYALYFLNTQFGAASTSEGGMVLPLLPTIF